MDTLILKKIMNRIGRALIEAVYPTVCAVCDKMFRTPPDDDEVFFLSMKGLYKRFEDRFPDIGFREATETFVCPACSGDYNPAELSLCDGCGRILEQSGKNRLCKACAAARPRFGTVRSCGPYDGVMKKAVHRYKYDRQYQLSYPLSYPLGILLFAAFVKHGYPEKTDVIVPVPIHAKKHRKRTFNQAYLLIRKWPVMAEVYNIDISRIRIEPEALLKTRLTHTQVGMTREQRVANLRDSFKVPRPSLIQGQRVLLVDDVITTGATAGECARILLNHGARSTDVLTLARTVRRI